MPTSGLELYLADNRGKYMREIGMFFGLMVLSSPVWLLSNAGEAAWIRAANAEYAATHPIAAKISKAEAGTIPAENISGEHRQRE